MNDRLLAEPDATDDDLVAACAELGRGLAALGLMIGTAESCTGGGIARALTETAGSSAWFDSAFVTYSNAAKVRLLHVPESVLAAHGAVSEPVVLAMARGAVEAGGVDVAIAVTGVAGPGGGSPDKPVGTVWFGFARRSRSPGAAGEGTGIESTAECRLIEGDRRAVRLRTALHAVRRARSLWL